ncbi:hypothetical protein B1813_19435 [Saccharomonospora piscinae]|uniref:Uncharacterized protein n=1 Tax=Saccharomonospora piscinae TaxID=687388 RepID=A0A1V8ZZ29_SACPI|nr:hypothetical protein [Saccharomonospora piscinae]OQO90003.1 hypothetical protein B1813_19435 [Saccharomonospora piscinae]
MTSTDPTNNPRIAEAMAKLEQAEAGLDRSISQARRLQSRMPKSGLSREDIEQIAQHARSKDAPKELRELQARIDSGEVSWNDIAEGRFLDDPQVRRALEGGVEGMRQAYVMINEGHELDEIIEPGGPPSTPDRPADRDDRDDDPGDDYFDGPVLR